MIERTFLFGENNNLVGTVCLPDTFASLSVAEGAAKAGVILFNAGIVHRIGPHRINVKLARRLAGEGIPSLRFDLSGLGDSAPTAGNVPFELQAVNDLRAAMDALAAATGLARFGLFGFCSGAFHSINAAVADSRIADLMLFEAYRYGTLQSRMRRRWLRVRHHGLLKTFLRVTAKVVKRICARIGAPATKASGPVSSSSYIADSPSAKTRFARDASALLARHVSISMVFAGDGLEIYNYAGQFADAFKRFGILQDIPVTFLRDVDHVATATGSQAQLAETVVSWALRCTSPAKQASTHHAASTPASALDLPPTKMLRRPAGSARNT